jgi:hypothetical protein
MTSDPQIQSYFRRLDSGKLASISGELYARKENEETKRRKARGEVQSSTGRRKFNSQLEIQIPLELRAKLDVFLFSDPEKRVPHGAYARFITDRLQEFFNKLDDLRRAVTNNLGASS